MTRVTQRSARREGVSLATPTHIPAGTVSLEILELSRATTMGTLPIKAGASLGDAVLERMIHFFLRWEKAAQNDQLHKEGAVRLGMC